MPLSRTARRLNVALALLLLSGCASETPKQPESGLDPMPNWPPRLIYNTDGNWAFNYLHRRDVKDLTIVLNALTGKGVDVVSVLVGIDDDLSEVVRMAACGEKTSKTGPRTRTPRVTRSAA